ncbi:hypothetical protein A0J61_00989 [Choanephora cucurbitarum]|uniref:Uncharacterized protein n=1 Tax=Choanephora cucurbitarum TaxID=101091 RepID=A0A1C7NPA1_9FUNG|nr:hypothetical protein A0J61_00989 [Choanephora cucurbitarum]
MSAQEDIDILLPLQLQQQKDSHHHDLINTAQNKLLMLLTYWIITKRQAKDKQESRICERVFIYGSVDIIAGHKDIKLKISDFSFSNDYIKIVNQGLRFQ